MFSGTKPPKVCAAISKNKGFKNVSISGGKSYERTYPTKPAFFHCPAMNSSSKFGREILFCIMFSPYSGPIDPWDLSILQLQDSTANFWPPLLCCKSEEVYENKASFLTHMSALIKFCRITCGQCLPPINSCNFCAISMQTIPLLSEYWWSLCSLLVSVSWKSQTIELNFLCAFPGISGPFRSIPVTLWRS